MMGGYELGFVSKEGTGPDETGGDLAYWGVENVDAAVEQLRAKGAIGRVQLYRVA